MENVSKMAIVGVVLACICAVMSDRQEATVGIAGFTLSAHVADTYSQRQIGLAKYASANDIGADGLLFTFATELPRSFWMKDMAFPIDILWIKDGKVVRLDENVPAPKESEAPVSLSSSPVSIDMVLELPAGKAEYYGLESGMSLDISLDGTPVTW